MNMKKLILILLLGLVAFTSCAWAGHVDVGVYVGFPTPVVYERPVYYPPPPPVVYPPVVYYPPQPVVYYPPSTPYRGYYYNGTYFYGGYPRYRGNPYYRRW